MVQEKERSTVEAIAGRSWSPFQIVFKDCCAMTLVIVLGSALALLRCCNWVCCVPVRGSRRAVLLPTALVACSPPPAWAWLPPRWRLARPGGLAVHFDWA